MVKKIPMLPKVATKTSGPGLAAANIRLLSDHPAVARRKYSHNLQSQAQISGVDLSPDFQKLERARIIYELTVAWDVDLALVAIVAADALRRNRP